MSAPEVQARNHRTERELLRYFMENEQQIRKENPPLFWQIIDRLTANQHLITESPGSAPGLFLLMKSFTFAATV